MRTLYIAVTLVLILCILLFVAAFIYLDKESRKTYHYKVTQEGRDAGAVVIDKFITEDKLIYKSISRSPFDPVFTESKSRLVLDRRYGFEEYLKESSNDGTAAETVYVEKGKGSVSFVATYGGEFASLERVPVKDGTFVFEESSPVTYLPIIENYDFKRGRSQGFNALTHFATFLPPMKRFVTLTSICDEYLEVDSKRVKVERLLLKIRNYPQGTVWISKSDRSLAALEIPAGQLRITRTFSPKSFEAVEYIPQSGAYLSRDIYFNNKNVLLAGTLTFPKKEMRYPLVLLVGGAGPFDRQYLGLFSSIADHLSKNGFAVFRFDKRGIGASGGNFDAARDADEMEDINIAIEILRDQSEIDPERIVLMGHAKGACYASILAGRRSDIKGMVMLGPAAMPDIGKEENLESLRKTASRLRWSDEYLKLVMRCEVETSSKVKNSKSDWTSVLGRRCFLGRMREGMGKSFIDAVKGLKIPILILQGKEDGAAMAELGSRIDKVIADGGNQNHILIYFSYLDSFFGKRISDGTHKIYYKTDPKVLETIEGWLNRLFAEPEKQAQGTESTTENGVFAQK